MSGPDILAEWRAASPLTQIEIDWFLRQGIPPMALVRPLALGIDTVVFHGIRFEFGRYVPRGTAGEALILSAFDEWGELADLIAWFPKAGSLGSWLGRVPVLGAEQVLAPRLGVPLVVHESPLEWLRAERTGVLVVDPKMGAALLREAGPLAVASVSYGERLRKMLSVPLPRVLVAVPDADRRVA